MNAYEFIKIAYGDKTMKPDELAELFAKNAKALERLIAFVIADGQAVTRAIEILGGRAYNV